MFRSNKVTLMVVAIVAASLGVLAARVLRPSVPLVLQAGSVVQPPKNIPSFALVDQQNKTFTNDRLRGHWSLMFFGFANCGDICPTTLTLMTSIKRSLNDLPVAERPQIIFVSVDPTRDTPERLRAYAGKFDADLIGVTGSQADVDAVTKSLGVPSAIRPLPNGGYAVDHYAGMLLTDPDGSLHALFGAPHTLATVAADYR